MRRRWLSFLVLSAALFGERNVQATVSDPNFQETPLAGALGLVTGIAWAPDASNRLFYLLKGGTVGIIQNGVVLGKPFVTIAPLFTASECGLIGIAFDPGFATNHYLYLFTTISATEQQIVRYTDNDGVGEAPKVVVAGLPTRGVNHDGGGIGIGPDGKLYWSIGDNGNQTGAGLDLTSLAAKIGRANLDGTAPTDNPFVDGDGPNNDLIWARGFRNPFSLTFQPSTEQLWLSVTGGAFEQIFAPHAGENGGWSKYESNQGPGFVRPVISYRTNDVMSVALTASAGAVRKNGVATFKTQLQHRFVPGAKISVTGVTDPSFNGDNYIVDVLSMNLFTFAQPGPDATSGGGAVTTQDLGGAVTGGAFWDSSALPAAYRENFFFGDYNSGRIMRAVVGAANKVKTVDTWATGNEYSVDVEPGPDGALYYAGVSGNIYRASYLPKAQGLVVSKLHLRTREGAATTFGVHLAKAPAVSTTVRVKRISGDIDLDVSAGDTLSFNGANWSQPQFVLVSAAEDPDSVDDEAELEVASAGLSSEQVRVRATDDDQPSLVLSPESLTLEEGDSGSVDVRLSQPPTAAFDVSVGLADHGANVSLLSSATLHFTPDSWATTQTVDVESAQDDDRLDGDAVLSFSGGTFPAKDVRVRVIDDDQESGGAGGQTAAPIAGGGAGEQSSLTGGAAGETSGTNAAGKPSSQGEDGDGDGGLGGAHDPSEAPDSASSSSSSCSCRVIADRSGAYDALTTLAALTALLRRRRQGRRAA